jgi:uridine kinase
VIRASIDDFLHPRAQRYARGEYSAEGCYYDTHDNDALIDYLLDPLSPSGHRRIRQAAYDHTTDTVLSPPPTTAPGNAVLIVDGVFLLRPELTARWDLRIFVSTAPDKTVNRAALREGHRSSRTEIEHRWRNRYLPAQQLYVADANPIAQADTVVHNDNPPQPTWETKHRREGDV